MGEYRMYVERVRNIHTESIRRLFSVPVAVPISIDTEFHAVVKDLKLTQSGTKNEPSHLC